MASKKPVKGKKFSVKEYQFSICREQHHWIGYDATVDKAAGIGYRVQKCEYCLTKKYTTIYLRDGSYLKNSKYVYPDGYRVEGGLSRGDKSRLRLRNFMSELSDEED